MKTTLLCALLLVLSACSQASEPTASSTLAADAPLRPERNGDAASSPATDPPYKVSFRQKYPQASAVSWSKDDHGYHEAHFEQEGKSYRADFTKDGRWVETERSIDYDELPDRVKTVIKDEYDPDDVVEVEFVDNGEKGQFYDVELKEKGKKFDVEIAADGRILKIGN